MVVGETIEQTDLVVIGGGPGGYTAAVRAGQLGIKTILIDRESVLGGVCLREGCIPSKALLHIAEVIESSKRAATYGVNFAAPQLDLDKVRSWKGTMIDKLSQGIVSMCKTGKVEIITGAARFVSSRALSIYCEGENPRQIKFKHAIIASGSSIVRLPHIFKRPQDAQSKRVLDSKSALQIPTIPNSLLIVGGGYVGLELGTVYAAMGSAVTIIEMTDGLLPGIDRDLVKPLANNLNSLFKSILLNTKMLSVEDCDDGVFCTYQNSNQEIITNKFDYVLIAVGRKPNSQDLGLENTTVELDKAGFIKVDQYCYTANKEIMAIGDVTGPPMLAHKAMRQGHVAAEILSGMPSAFDNLAIPAIVYTEPEIAWCGLTETEARARGYKIEIAKIPWSTSGRALTLAEPNGLTKIIYDPDTMLVKGAGVTGIRAGGFIAEVVLAIEAGLVVEDLVRTVHPHPSLSETIGEAAMTAVNRKARQQKEQSSITAV